MTNTPIGPDLGTPVGPEEFTRLMHALVPISAQLGIIADYLGEDGSARLSLPYAESFIRPGGSISGPTLMAMADLAMFAGVSGKLGWTPMALTMNQSTTFLKPPKPEGLIAETTPLRFGRRMVFFAVSIFNESALDVPVAHITGSYALPQ